MTPVEASKVENELTVYENLYPDEENKIKSLNSKSVIGLEYQKRKVHLKRDILLVGLEKYL